MTTHPTRDELAYDCALMRPKECVRLLYLWHTDADAFFRALRQRWPGIGVGQAIEVADLLLRARAAQ